MSNFKLNLPTDIPWERVCVTEDMIDRNICDRRMPSKWQTSMAVFKYRPEDEDQLYPAYTITYLKVTATLTGYQPLDKEIQGRIDWHGVNVSTIPGLTDLLNSYNPCHGAILQVLVGPHDHESVPVEEYPFFIDFEPKKRELYEMATDTKEKQSRSIESLNITKSAGSTQSMEILDVDQGGGGFGMQGSYAGTGGGFNYTAPNGQWGTKRLNADESLSSRSSDVGTEKRETYSYFTQLSQMYHLLDSYHLGTNRAIFFVQPRPHTLEEPSGFVRGPRPVEGIQEFFMVVAQPKDQEDFCVALRLDTSHLTKTPIMDFERKSTVTDIAAATAPVASPRDISAENIVGARACAVFDCWDVHYQCFRTERSDTVTYQAPAGFRIESWDDLIDESSHGTTNVTVTPNSQTLTINVEAVGHCCYEGNEVCVNCPDTIQSWAGSARRQAQVNLVSTTPTKQVGQQEVLMITTRGLCCCSREDGIDTDDKVLSIVPIPSWLQISDFARPVASAPVVRYADNAAQPTAEPQQLRSVTSSSSPCADCAKSGGCARCGDAIAPESSGVTIRKANELGDFIHAQALRTLNDPYATPQTYLDTDFFAKQLENAVVQTRTGREMLAEPASRALPEETVTRLARHLRIPADELTVRDAWRLRVAELESVTGMGRQELRQRRLQSLGVRFTDQQSDTTADRD